MPGGWGIESRIRGSLLWNGPSFFKKKSSKIWRLYTSRSQRRRKWGLPVFSHSPSLPCFNMNYDLACTLKWPGIPGPRELCGQPIRKAAFCLSSAQVGGGAGSRQSGLEEGPGV